jgi:hypothetical protein
VVGDSAEVRSEAEKLAKTICDSDRVRQLAKNPLLLTTLLLVKRWVGQLPTRRSVLYGKAIEVLLMTWNVEGYEPIDQEEAIPQLAFVAFTMMKEGVQRLSSRRLKEILILARKSMPEVLGYARHSVSEFIQRVELRSSIMILSGHEIEQGTLYPLYEFRHLTFQEYLAALAVVDGYYPVRKESDDLLSMLEPHLENEWWKEVVPLAAVLAGRKVEPLIRHLIDHIRMPYPGSVNPDYYEYNSYRILLKKCILDEIYIAPNLLEEGLERIARRADEPFQLFEIIFNKKYGELFHRIVNEAFIHLDSDRFILGDIIALIAITKINENIELRLTSQQVKNIKTLLVHENPIQRASGALAIKFILTYGSLFQENINLCVLLKPLGDLLVPLLHSNESYLHFAASWAFSWLGGKKFWTPERNPNVIARLLEIWKESSFPNVQNMAFKAISSFPLIDRASMSLPEPDAGLVNFIQLQTSFDAKDDPNKTFDESIDEMIREEASLVIAYYYNTPWNDEELAQHIAEKYENVSYIPSIIESLLKALGELGKIQLEALKKKSSRSHAIKARSKKRAKKSQKRQPKEC